MCNEPAVVMKDAKNGGKNFYCIKHYEKISKKDGKRI